MKKKVLALLVAMLLVLTALPSAAFADEVPDWFTADAIQEEINGQYGVEAKAFAKLVYKTIAADENFNVGDYSSVKDVLAAYDGEIKLTSEDEAVNDIQGINLLPNARIIIENSQIINLHPLGSLNSRGEAVSVNGNPIYLWPAKIPNLPTSGNTYSIPTDFRSQGTAVYVNDGTAKSQTVTFMVKVDGETVWDTDYNEYLEANNSYFDTNGAVSTTTVLNEWVDSVTWQVEGTGYGIARMAIPAFIYIPSSRQPQTLWPAYEFKLDSVYYDTLKVDVEAETTGAFYLLKVKAGTENDEEPVVVAGATYGLYTDEACTDPVIKADAALEIVTADEPVLVDGLVPGTYYLKEIVPAPKYNISDEVVEIVIPEAEAEYTVDGLKELDVTPDQSRWQNDWTSNTNLQKLDLICLDSAVKAVAGEGDYEDYAAFIGGPDAAGITEIAVVNDADETGFEYEYAGAVIKYGEDEITLGKDDDLVAAINGLIPDKVGNIEVTLKVNYAQLLDPAKDTVVVADEPLTIWVENTTGDEKGTPGFKKDAGGYVYICLDEEGTKSNVSSDEPVNGTGDDNTVNRQECYLACGVADVENGWKVAVDKIQVGSMGADGKSGALTYITQLPKYTEGADEYYDEETGEFRFLDAASEKYIMGKLNFDEENQKACVEIVEMDQNIDVAIPFYKEAPQTGMNGMILLYSMLLVAAVYVMAAFRKARKAL